MSIPSYYDELNLRRGHTLPTSLNLNSKVYYYFQRSLYQRLISKFDFTVPEHWEKDIFICELVMLGFVGVFNTNKYANGDITKMFGIVPEPATLSDIGVQYQPTKISTANHAFYMPEPEIIYQGAGLIKISNDYCGLMDIVDYYAAQFAILSATFEQSLINSRFSFAVGANSRSAAETLKAIFDSRNSGDPFIVFDKKKILETDITSGSSEPWSVIDFKAGSNYIVDKLMNAYRNLLNQFDTEIGIPNNAHEKAERLITNEVESNSVETVARFTTWLEALQLSIEKTIRTFPELRGKLSVKARVYDTGQTGAKEAGKEVSDGGISEDNSN